ncbi:MAG: MotA/TolQ/ExbB proton channel family protein [Bacteroidota bacterium]|nr:MotA/TolQ/ExbB proton channel family protein [Bacteroidota bacterium]
MTNLLFVLQVNVQNAVADTLAKAVPAAAPVVQEKTMSLWDLAMKGGWIMIPIGILFLATLFIFFERYFYIKMAAKTDTDFMNKIRDYMLHSKLESAQNLCQATNMPVARMVEKGIKRIGRPLKEIEESIEIVGKFEVYKLEKNLVILGVIAGIAPMFGFIGTIAGVIKIFYNISLADNISIGLIASGLYEKMVTSAAGLLVGILSFIAYHWLNVMIEKVVHTLEYNTMNFIDLLQEPTK